MIVSLELGPYASPERGAAMKRQVIFSAVMILGLAAPLSAGEAVATAVATGYGSSSATAVAVARNGGTAVAIAQSGSSGRYHETPRWSDRPVDYGRAPAAGHRGAGFSLSFSREAPGRSHNAPAARFSLSIGQTDRPACGYVPVVRAPVQSPTQRVTVVRTTTTTQTRTVQVRRVVR